MTFYFFVTVLLGVVLSAQPALAHVAPVIAPVRLDFDARQAPKNCNDDLKFRNLLANWVVPDVLSVQTDRRLVVRIRRSPTGKNLADLTLVDAAGATVGEHHEQYGVKTECHFVLYDTAYAAAKLLGAFDKPPPPEPCPTCPPPPAPAKPEPCPTCPVCPAPTPIVPRIDVSSASVRRAYFGAGVFLGTGIVREGAIGPFAAFGFVLSPHMPRIQFEMAGAWASQTLPKSTTGDALQVDMVPIVGSICYSRYVFRICSGLVTTFYTAKRTNVVPGHDEFRMTFGANVQMGTEFEITGPLSIRLDVFGRMRFAERTFGQELANIDEQRDVMAGAAAMAMWSFE